MNGEPLPPPQHQLPRPADRAGLVRDDERQVARSDHGSRSAVRRSSTDPQLSPPPDPGGAGPGAVESAPEVARGSVAGAVLLGLSARVVCRAVARTESSESTLYRFAVRAADARACRRRHGRAAPLHPLRIVSRLERRFDEDRATHGPLRWFSGGVLVSADSDAGAPLLLLGADALRPRIVLAAAAWLARDAGARPLLATLCRDAHRCARRRRVPATREAGSIRSLSRVTEFVLVLPAIYVMLALRAAMPLVLPGSTIFVLAARDLRAARMADGGARRAGHRRVERTAIRVAADALRARARRACSTRHLLPAAAVYLSTQATPAAAGIHPR